MPKLTQAASIIALSAVASSALAWYPAPVAPVITPEMAEQQMQAITAHHDAMAQQHMQQLERFMDGQRALIEQQAPWAAGPVATHPFAAPAFPEPPAVPELGQMPELPPMPKLGEIPQLPELAPMPGLPEMPSLADLSSPESMKARIQEMDAHRDQVRKQMDERRAAFKAMSEERRAQRGLDHPYMVSYAPGMHPAMMPAAPEQQPAQTEAAQEK